jgi:hypothetical protein
MPGLQRNPYDRVIHFGFGLLLAYPCPGIVGPHWGSWQPGGDLVCRKHDHGGEHLL